MYRGNEGRWRRRPRRTHVRWTLLLATVAALTVVVLKVTPA